MSSKSSNQESQQAKRRGSNFLYEVKEELSKTSWTPRKELFSLTRVVIASTFIFGFILFFIDMSLKNVVQVMKIGFHSLFG
jgi:preprotein translocase SecE subunit